MLIEVNPLKESMLLGSLNVVLPTVDVYSDVALAVKLYSNVSVVLDGRTHYSNGHPKWATSLLIPFLVATFHSSTNPDRIFYPKQFRIGNSIRQGFFRKPRRIGFFIRNGFG